MPYTEDGVAWKGGETSRGAIKASRKAILQEMVFNMIEDRGPISGHEIARITGVTLYSILPRCTELRQAGRIFIADSTGLSANNRAVMEFTTEHELL